jgi:hypothetical protein
MVTEILGYAINRALLNVGAFVLGFTSMVWLGVSM